MIKNPLSKENFNGPFNNDDPIWTDHYLSQIPYNMRDLQQLSL